MERLPSLGERFASSDAFARLMDDLKSLHTATCWKTYDEAGCTCDTYRVPRPPEQTTLAEIQEALRKKP